IRAEGDVIDRGGETLETGEFLAGGRVPQLQLSRVVLEEIAARRGELLAVRTEGDAVNEGAVSPERARLTARVRGPELDGLVTARRGQAFAVGTEDDAVDGAGVALEAVDFLAGGEVPDLDLARLVVQGVADRYAADGGEAFAVGAEGGTINAAGVPLERKRF